MNLCLVVAVASVSAAQSGVSVTTWHNDNSRTGQNASETVLTPGTVDQYQNQSGNVTTETFGLLCGLKLNQYFYNQYGMNLWSGQIYGQPLVVADSNGDGGMMVYVATMDDAVFAIQIPPSWNGTCSAITSVTVAWLLDQAHGGSVTETVTSGLQTPASLGATRTILLRPPSIQRLGPWARR